MSAEYSLLGSKDCSAEKGEVRAQARPSDQDLLSAFQQELSLLMLVGFVDVGDDLQNADVGVSYSSPVLPSIFLACVMPCWHVECI